MGGMDLMGSFIGRYHIRIKSRKRTTRLFYHLLDMTLKNAWVPYKKTTNLLPSQTRQLHYLELNSQFTTDVQRISRKDNWIPDSLSRIEEIQLSSSVHHNHKTATNRKKN
ncbi:hypothetical protein NPIL_156051 [Nephila pilipes]|uniref:PiggyBac transposable element-derived protein domain-containing protein n=1 Tax=Nephila pilipes TaxID=299642 RepID=A0A8X6T753_NEPPI|nr:hypothetical protein NPIL_156051 [Nephila pilipes]